MAVLAKGQFLLTFSSLNWPDCPVSLYTLLFFVIVEKQTFKSNSVAMMEVKFSP